MELKLYRSYFKEGTNGTLFSSFSLGTTTQERFLCHTIELPWRHNKPNTSCIPEGRYRIETRFSDRFHHHLILRGVKNRRFILVHPGNNAQRDLEGCIAPVTYLKGPGKGLHSRDAMQKLLSLVHQSKDRKEQIYLIIKNSHYETHRTL